MRKLFVLLLGLATTPAAADDWGDCRDEIRSRGGLIADKIVLEHFTFSISSPGISVEQPIAKGVVTFYFDNGQRVSLHQGNTQAVTLWNIAHQVTYYPTELQIIGAYIDGQVTIFLPGVMVDDRTDCISLGFPTTATLE